MQNTTARQWFVMAFCCWHMAAVMAFSMPATGEINAMNWIHSHLTSAGLCQGASVVAPLNFLRRYGFCEVPGESYTAKRWVTGTLRQITRPYIMMTSQWQQWNVFAPDPLRRVSSLVFEVNRDGVWEPYLTIGPETVQWWRFAYLLKSIRRLAEDDSQEPIARRLTRITCLRFNIPFETPVRVQEHYYVIPNDVAITSPSWWESWQPEYFDRILSTTTCPQSL